MPYPEMMVARYEKIWCVWALRCRQTHRYALGWGADDAGAVVCVRMCCRYDASGGVDVSRREEAQILTRSLLDRIWRLRILSDYITGYPPSSPPLGF